MERPNAKGSHNFLVGLFVCVALLVSTGFIVFMGSSLFGSEFKINTAFKDVRGLNIGAPVFLSGIQVGRVSDKTFPNGNMEGFKGNPKNKIMVVLTIYTSNKERIKEDSKATITTQGVLGDKVVVISPGDNDTEHVNPGDWIGTDEPKELNDYFAEGGNLVANLSKAAVHLNSVLESINKSGKVDTVLENLDTSAKALAKILTTLQKGESSMGAMIVGGDKDKLASSLAKLDKILSKVEKGQGTLGALVNDASLHEDLKVLLGGAKRSGTIRYLMRQAIQEGDKPQKE